MLVQGTIVSVTSKTVLAIEQSGCPAAVFTCGSMPSGAENGDSVTLDTQALTCTLNASLNDKIFCYSEVVSLADLNAGKVLVAGASNVTLVPLAFSAVVAGNFATVTSYIIQDTNDTPVNIQSLLVAALTDGAQIFDGASNVTRGAGMFKALTAGKGIQVVKSGSAGTGGTSIRINLLYKKVGVTS